jgi:hypothetical protein
MPIEFWTSLERDLVLAKWFGAVTVRDFREAFSRYLMDANYRPGRTELSDFTNVTDFDADFPSIWAALNMVNNQVPGQKVRTRTLFVAPGDLMFGLTRIYQTLAENADGISVEIYRTERDALAVLGLPFATLDDLCQAGGFLPHVSATRLQARS